MNVFLKLIVIALTVTFLSVYIGYHLSDNDEDWRISGMDDSNSVNSQIDIQDISMSESATDFFRMCSSNCRHGFIKIETRMKCYELCFSKINCEDIQ